MHGSDQIAQPPAASITLPGSALRQLSAVGQHRRQAPNRPQRWYTRLSSLPVLLITGLLSGGQQVLAAADSGASHQLLSEQRAAFRAVYPAAVRGNWAPAAAQASLLERYILWPDIRGAYLKATISRAPSSDIDAFLKQYGSLKPARELRYRYALQLAKSGRTASYRKLYHDHYEGMEVARLDCLALHGDIKDGNTKDLLKRSKPLWLVGKSQVDECDPVFAFLRKNGQLTAALYQERYDIAITERNFGLAGYLARSLGSATEREAATWKQARNQPEAVLRAASTKPLSATQRAQGLYALERLGYRQPALAHKYWQRLQSNTTFSKAERNEIEHHIALWAVRRNIAEAPRLVDQLPRGVIDDDIRTWQLRALLKTRNWPKLASSIDALPKAQRNEEVWQYWLGHARQQQGEKELAERALDDLSTKRSYYGFLAADALQRDYSFEHEEMTRNDSLIEKLREQHALQRAIELYRVDLDAKGRAEWNETVAQLSRREQQQAALLAHDLGWHSRAIALAAKTGDFNALDLRYPLPYHTTFQKYAAKANIRDSWAYGIARSESLFMRDIRSSAGAVGLMQLMPETGKRTAKSLRVPYRGVSTLIQPERNIQLGTAYLGKMYKRFDDNAVLATASYNAGPGNVSRWLAKTDNVDARVWIENIPFQETRKYVRRVLEADTVFHWRMTGEQLRISQSLAPIVGKLSNTDKIASR